MLVAGKGGRARAYIYARRGKRVKKAFQCTHTMGASAPSLHRDSRSLIVLVVQVQATAHCALRYITWPSRPGAA